MKHSWKLAGDRAELAIGGLTATVTPARPFDGLVDVQWLGRPFPATRLLAVRTDTALPGAPEVVADAYVRGPDLVATYVQAPPRTVRPQIYWRAVNLGSEREPAAGCELIVSMQTSLLDSDPALFTETELPAGEVRRLAADDCWQPLSLAAGRLAGSPADGAGVLLFRSPETEWSYAEMVHPADFLGFELAEATTANQPAGTHSMRLAFRLFGERLEKGVIRRVRVRGMFLPRHRDEEAALAAYRHLADEPLPLTT